MIFPLLSTAVLLLLLEPFLAYLWDSKKLRRFPNATPFSAYEKHSTIRIGPNTLSFCSPSAIRSIYGHSTPCTKGGSYEATLGPHPGLIDVVDKELHASKRRILSNAFATRNLEGWCFKVADKVRQFVIQFDRISHGGVDGTTVPGSVDFRKWANLFSVEAIADIAISRRLGCLERGDDLVTFTTVHGAKKQTRFVHTLHSARRATSFIVWSTRYQLLKAGLETIPGFFKSQTVEGEVFPEIIASLLHERVERYKAGEDLDDLARCLLEDKGGRSRDVTEAQIEGDRMPGPRERPLHSHTSCVFLPRTPFVLEALRDEVAANVVFDKGGVATYESVKNLRYLRACLDESLRLLPPVSTGLHRLTPPNGLTIDGHWIPEKTIAVVPIYTAHRNSDLFPEAAAFRPERRLENSAKDAQASFIPFSAGTPLLHQA
ncbi:unnamed protein product [Clonostachys solani]|uniref:Cytochrome P450 n=1 Tax=Clonostachys solani TaxID=160281 RepID=A0A9N9ZN42_9HYPO|nr:unnamed protein product [Clonostachys solani]